MVCRECGAYNAEHLSHCRVCAARLKDGPDTDASALDTAASEEGRPSREFVRAPSWPQRAYSGAPEAPVHIPPDEDGDGSDTGSDGFDSDWQKSAPASAPAAPVRTAAAKPAAPARAASTAPAAAKPAAARNCAVCGKQLLPDAPFCAYCGAHVGLSDEEPFSTTGRTPAMSRATQRPAAAAAVPARRAPEPASYFDEEDEDEEAIAPVRPAKAKKAAAPRKKARDLDEDEYEDDAYEDDEYEDEDEDEDDDDMPAQKSRGTTILFWALILLLVALIAVFGMYIVKKNYGGNINNLISSVFGGSAPQSEPQPDAEDPNAGVSTGANTALLGTGTIEEGVSEAGTAVFNIDVYAPTGSTLQINTTTDLNNNGTITIPRDDHMILQIPQTAFLPNAPVDASIITIEPDIQVTTPTGESYKLKIEPITVPAQALTLTLTEPLTDTVNANYGNAPITVSGTVDDHTVSVFVGGVQTTVYADEQGNGVFTASYQPQGGTEPETLLVEAKKNNCMTTTATVTIEPYVVQNMALVISNDVAGLTASNGQVTLSGTVTPGAAVTAVCASSSVTCGTVSTSETGNFSLSVTLNDPGAYEVKISAKLEGYNDAEQSCYVERYPTDSSSTFRKASKKLSAEEHAKIVAGTATAGNYTFAGKITELVGTTPYTVFKATLSSGEEVVLCNRSTKNTIGTDDVKKSKTFAGTLVGTYGDTGLPYIWCWFIWNS